jgi:hypothetical protein
MAHTIKSLPCIGGTPPVVALPHDLHEETHEACHESEFSEASEQFSDEDSDYGICA